MAKNVEALKKEGSIRKDAKLSEAEEAVIEGMSKDEIKVLVDLRKRLNKEMAKRGTTAIASGEVLPPSNIVV